MECYYLFSWKDGMATQYCSPNDWYPLWSIPICALAGKPEKPNKSTFEFCEMRLFSTTGTCSAPVRRETRLQCLCGGLAQCHGTGNAVPALKAPLVWQRVARAAMLRLWHRAHAFAGSSRSRNTIAAQPVHP